MTTETTPYTFVNTENLDPATIRREHAGVIHCSRARSTGTVVTLYRNDAQGLDDDDGNCPYSVVCENHGGVVAVESQYAGRRSMASPEDWCEDCRELLDARERMGSRSSS